MVTLDLLTNAYLLSGVYQAGGISEYQAYVREQRQVITWVQERDPSFYRINQTVLRGQVNYNESAGYNYASISGYTSDPSNRQLNFLEQAGYPKASNNMCIVNTSLLPVDSLLGVRYVITPQAIRGLVEIQDVSHHKQLRVYENPYALPIAFAYQPQAIPQPEDTANPFLFHSWLYQQLYDPEAKLYTPLSYVEEELPAEDSESPSQETQFVLQVPQGSVALYGNLSGSRNGEGSVSVDGIRMTHYFDWVSPSAFYIPTSPGQREVTVTLTRLTGRERSDQRQFYALDLEALSQIAQRSQQSSAQEIVVENGFFSCRVDSGGGQSLFVSIPYDKGWTVLRNGEEILPEAFAGCLMTLPLEAGENRIEMRYRLPGAMPGLVLSLVGVALLVALALWEKKRKGALSASRDSGA